MKRFLPFLLILVLTSCNMRRGNPAGTIVKKVKDCCTALVIHPKAINPESGASSVSTNIAPVLATPLMERSVQSLTW